jgi:hypothetical protein
MSSPQIALPTPKRTAKVIALMPAWRSAVIARGRYLGYKRFVRLARMYFETRR